MDFYSTMKILVAFAAALDIFCVSVGIGSKLYRRFVGSPFGCSIVPEIIILTIFALGLIFVKTPLIKFLIFVSAPLISVAIYSQLSKIGDKLDKELDNELKELTEKKSD